MRLNRLGGYIRAVADSNVFSSALLCDITQRRVIILYTDVSGQRIGPVFKGHEVQEEEDLDFLSLEDGTDTLSRNVCKGLPQDSSHQHHGGSLKSRIL
jgi:hypothetical protein